MGVRIWREVPVIHFLPDNPVLGIPCVDCTVDCGVDCTVDCTVFLA